MKEVKMENKERRILEDQDIFKMFDKQVVDFWKALDWLEVRAEEIRYGSGPIQEKLDTIISCGGIPAGKKVVAKNRFQKQTSDTGLDPWLEICYKGRGVKVEKRVFQYNSSTKTAGGAFGPMFAVDDEAVKLSHRMGDDENIDVTRHFLDAKNVAPRIVDLEYVVEELEELLEDNKVLIPIAKKIAYQGGDDQGVKEAFRVLTGIKLMIDTAEEELIYLGNSGRDVMSNEPLEWPHLDNVANRDGFEWLNTQYNRLCEPISRWDSSVLFYEFVKDVVEGMDLSLNPRSDNPIEQDIVDANRRKLIGLNKLLKKRSVRNSENELYFPHKIACGMLLEEAIAKTSRSTSHRTAAMSRFNWFKEQFETYGVEDQLVERFKPLAEEHDESPLCGHIGISAERLPAFCDFVSRARSNERLSFIHGDKAVYADCLEREAESEADVLHILGEHANAREVTVAKAILTLHFCKGDKKKAADVLRIDIRTLKRRVAKALEMANTMKANPEPWQPVLLEYIEKLCG